MGKIKIKLVKRAGEALVTKDLPFGIEFKANKKILGRDMPSKKIRNQIAGYISRLKQRENVEAAKLAVKKEKEEKTKTH